MEDLLQTDFENIYQESLESVRVLAGKKLLLTGGTGFFGKWILGFLNYANQAHQLNLQIFVLSRDPESFLKQYPQFSQDYIHFIQGDIRNFAFDERVDFVIHAATEASAKLNAEQPSEMFNVIVEGTQHLLNVCKKLGPARILMTSSGAVYGTQASNVTHQPDESLMGPDLHHPGSAYAEGKRVSELLGTFHSLETGQEVNFARCYAFVGPYLPLNTHFAVGNFMNDCLNERKIVVKGDGTACRSYMYAADLVIWLLKILTHGKNLRSYNVGSEVSLSISELAHLVSGVWTKMTDKSASVKVEKAGLSQAPHRYVPLTLRAHSELGLEVNTQLSEALEKTFRYHLK